MKNAAILKVFFISLALSSLLAMPFILDLTLTPRFLALAVCILLIFYFIIQSELAGVLKPDLLLISYLAYTGWCCLSVLWANTKSEAIFESSKQALGLFVFSLTFFFLKKERDQFQKTLLKISILLFIAAILIAIYQLTNLPSFDKETFYNITGTSGHKNLFSSFLFLNLFFLIAAYFKLEDSWKSVSIICILLNCTFIFLLGTKAVWLAICVSMAIFILLHFFSKYSKHPKLKFPVSLIITVLLANIFFMNFLQPLIHKSIRYTSASPSAHSIKLEQERLILWDKTYQLINQKPVYGLGMGNWQIHFPDATLSNLWRAEDLNFTFQRPHNDFLWILSETGLIGFNLFLLFLISLLYMLIRTLFYVQEHNTLRYTLILCTSFIVGYFLISFFDFPKERIEHTVWINILLGIAYFHIKTYGSLKTFGEIRIGKLHTRLAFCLVTVIAFTGLMRLNGECFTRRMMNYKNNGQLADAISAGNSAMSFAYSLDPTSVPLFWYIGNCKATFGNYSEAQADFISAYKLNPFNRNVLNDLGSSYVFTNNVTLAKKYYEEAARISPRFDEPKLNLAAMYINAKDFKTADFWLKSLMHDSERRANYERIIEITK